MQDLPIGREALIGPIGREAFIGIGVAIVLGLSVGAAVKPTAKELQTTPQPEMDVASLDRGSVAKPDPGWARYGSHLPSWVLGTDLLKASQPYTPPTEPVAQREMARQDREPEASMMIPARYQEAFRPEPSYPSQDGDTLSDRAARSAPPHMEDLPDPDAPSD
jgi:hypothetical protein